jgi:streptogramin lyase
MARRTPSGALWFTEAEGNKIGRITPPLPTSKDQCMNGGWMDFPRFKNQGDCVSFVETGK